MLSNAQVEKKNKSSKVNPKHKHRCIYMSAACAVRIHTSLKIYHYPWHRCMSVQALSFAGSVIRGVVYIQKNIAPATFVVRAI